MKLWRENRLDQEWEKDNKEIAKEFKESKFFKDRHTKYRGAAMALIWFISDKTGLNSTHDWDKSKGSIEGSKDILEILDLIGEE